MTSITIDMVNFETDWYWQLFNLRIGKPLGKGTFGQVKQGTHILTGEKVSILDDLQISTDHDLT